MVSYIVFLSNRFFNPPLLSHSKFAKPAVRAVVKACPHHHSQWFVMFSSPSSSSWKTRMSLRWFIRWEISLRSIYGNFPRNLPHLWKFWVTLVTPLKFKTSPLEKVTPKPQREGKEDFQSHPFFGGAICEKLFKGGLGFPRWLSSRILSRHGLTLDVFKVLLWGSQYRCIPQRPWQIARHVLLGCVSLVVVVSTLYLLR